MKSPGQRKQEWRYENNNKRLDGFCHSKPDGYESYIRLLDTKVGLMVQVTSFFSLAMPAAFCLHHVSKSALLEKKYAKCDKKARTNTDLFSSVSNFDSKCLVKGTVSAMKPAN